MTVIRWVKFKFVHRVAPPIVFVAWWLKPFLSNVQNIATSIATDLFLSWPKVLNLVTVRASLKTPV